MASAKSSSRTRGESTYLFGRDGLLGGLGEFFNGLGVVTKIHFAANKDDGKALAEVKNLGNPLDKVSRMPFKTKPLSLLLHRHQPSYFHLLNNAGATKTHLLLDVVERVWRVDGETDQDDVGVGVRQRTETVVIFLTSRIPKGEFNVLAINLDIGNIVLENGGDVDLYKCIGSVWGCTRMVWAEGNRFSRIKL